MRSHTRTNLRSKSGVFTGCLAVLMMCSTGCFTQDWMRDVIASMLPFPLPMFIFLPIPVVGPPGAAGAAGAAGADGQDGAPGDNIIIARAVINIDGTIENTDHVTAVAHPVSPGPYTLTIDVSDADLPAGTTEDDFAIFVALKEIPPVEEQHAATYTPVSLVGTVLTINIEILADLGQPSDHAFSVQVLLPAE